MAEDAAVFVDAQLYLDLFRTASGKDLLAPLQEQREHIFITEQLVSEVNRHKLTEALGFFQRECQIGKAPYAKLPNHLFDEDGTIVRGIREKLTHAEEMIRQATTELDNIVAETLRLISLSEDLVSKSLAPLFQRAVVHEPEQLERAKMRNVRGIPPGKKVGAVGDELNWEQFMTFIKERRKKKLWIISRDSDYCVTHGKDKVYLVPALYQELIGLVGAELMVRAFRNIPDGIKDFARTTGVKAEKLPNPAKVEEIKKEQQKLPPTGWAAEKQTGTGSGSGSFVPQSYGVTPPPSYYSGSGSGSVGSGSIGSGQYDADPGSVDRESGQIQIYWDDGTKTPMVFDGRVWKGPTERLDPSGARIRVPIVEITEQGVFVDGICYPVQSRAPFFADFEHNGTRI